MASLPKKVALRLIAGIKRFQPILTTAKSRDLNESDTVMILTDMLSEVFGYDKYSEITSEQSIRSTFCDLAIKIDGEIKLLVEAKAIGLDLKENFVKQAIDYAANQGIEWVVLTNGEIWKIFKVTFGKPIGQELILEFNFLQLTPKNEEHLDHLFILSKEGWNKSAINLHFTRRQALNKFNIGIIALSAPILESIRKELRRLNADVKFDIDEIKALMMNEVLRREVIEGEKVDAARRQINRASSRSKKNLKKEGSDQNNAVENSFVNLLEEEKSST